MPEIYQLTSETPWCEAAANMYNPRDWEDITNLSQKVMLQAEGQAIPCDRARLAASSKFFHDKFQVNPKSGEHSPLVIKGIDFDTLKDVVYFVYNGRIQLTLEKAEKLIPASGSLMLPELTSLCKNFSYTNLKMINQLALTYTGLPNTILSKGQQRKPGV